MNPKAPKIAAIDVGTNSFHLVIASVNTRGMLQIHNKEKEVVRLGSSGKDMKYLQPDAMERGLLAMRNLSAIAAGENASVRAIATSAVREAQNKAEFLNMIKKETDVDIEVVSGQEEGRLIYLGALHALPIVSQNVLVIDIGGGSTETIIGYDGDVKYVKSAKLGAIRLTKAFFPGDTVSDEQIDQCRNYIRGEWSPIIKKLIETGFEAVVGTSGTIQNLAAMALSNKQERIPDNINGLTVSREEIFNVINKIIETKEVSQRANLPGIDPKRTDIILAGALILEHAFKQLNIQKIVISAYALREGIVFDTVTKLKSITKHPHLSHLRYDTVYNLCRQYHVNLVHAEHVRKLALKIFDDLSDLHNLGYAERELLETASLLHDVGYLISHDQHHKHSYYIICHCMMPGFTNDEAELIANIARYHRKSHPKKKHDNFAVLTDKKKYIIRVLSGILRIAEGLDRRQLQTLTSVKTLYDNHFIDIYITYDNNATTPEIELWGAERRKSLLELTLGKGIRFLQRGN